MKVYTKIIVSLTTEAVIECHAYDYIGPIAECISAGGSFSKSKSKSKSQQTSESGVKYNEDFLRKASAFATDEGNSPRYDPAYVMPSFTGANYVRVAPEGFQKLEDTVYEGTKSKLQRAYDTSLARQREELAQMGALNSPSQYLEGSARSSLDRSYMDSLQQAARDAFSARLGLEEREAGRETAYNQTEAARRTGFDTTEAARETGFNERKAAALIEDWLKKIGLAIESGRFSTGQGTSSGSGNSLGLSMQGSFLNFGGS